MTDRAPLIVTADEALLDDVLRLAAAAGIETEVAADVTAARPRWSAAPVVLVGVDALAAAVGGRLPRRDGVLVVGRADPVGSVWRQSVALGAQQVLALPAEEARLVAQLAEAMDDQSDAEAGLVWCCAGGCGGAGASVLASALALTAARDLGRSVLLVDLDPYGGGLDLTLGGESAGGLRWPDLAGTSGRVSAASLREALPAVFGVSVLATARDRPEDIAEETAHAVVAAGRRAGDVVVVDLPRAPSAAARVAATAADRVLLVVPSEVRAAAAAASTATRLSGWTSRSEVVVRQRPRSTLSPAVIARTLGLPLAGAARSEPGLQAALDRGEPPIRRPRGPLAGLCRALLAEVSAGPDTGRHHQRWAA